MAVFLSLYGDWLTTVALVVLLYELTGSPAGPAGYLLARVGPRLLGPWLGGSLADRYSARGVMVASAAVQAALTASLVLSDRAHSVWALYVAVAIAQFAGSIARPSYSAILPVLVSDRQLNRANGLYGTLFSTSIFVAPAIGAVLLARTGPDLLFALDAFTFLAAAMLAATLPTGRRRATAREDNPPAQAPVQSTVALVLSDPVTRLAAVANFAMGLTPTVAQAVLVVAARERFGTDASVGLLYSTVGIGGTVGGLLALRWQPPRERIRLAMAATALSQIVALAAFASLSARAPMLAVLALSTVASAMFDVWAITEIQRRAPPGYMGRYNAIPWAAQYAGMLVGALWALGTTTIFHWDLTLELACLAMAVVVSVAGIFVHDDRAANREYEEP